ncbi:MAG: hypothetical protein FWD22_00145, partial [Treponema sp.]|nr:hypothetical protein [Treponema sp.]
MKKCVLITFLLTIMVIGCNNFFHSLIPPDGDFILSFEVPGQMDKEIINNTDNTITLYVDKETNVNSLLPVIRISPYATVFPITLNYIQEAFPSVNIAREAMALYQADDMSEYLLNLVEENRKEFNVPAINKPIDFSGPVNFLVLAAAGNTRLYSVRVIVDSGEPKLSGIRFTKYDNPDLMSDALCFVNEAAATIYANARYPAEMGYTSFPLIPSFEIIGDSVEVDGLQIISGVDEIDFNAPSVSPQSKTITVHRGEESKNYSLIINFQEDKDTIRSITDFRFTKDKNSGISATAVGSIINNDNVGTINVQVYYSGVKPDTLTARFVTPGTVTVNGSLQTSDVTSNDFSLPLEYRVTSRNGLFVRTYSVNVEFISITADAPRFTSFRFNQRLNEDLVQDSEGQIGGDIIMIDVFYSSISAPQTLVPEFSAGGIVTVSGSIQVSGASAQNYSRQIKYTVTNPENPVLTRDYWVQVRFVQDVSSAANITSFGFYMDKNPELTEDLEARIDQATGRITIAAPIGSGVKSRIMIPDFTAAGTVKVNDVVQTSGESGLMFTLSVTYTVVSANGMNTRTYEVIVRELSSPIFVNINAAGMNDGTNWTDAFISLQAACEAASFFPDTTDVVIWIAAGTYKPSAIGNPEEYFLISPNTSYIGGFEGWETSKEQRINPTANKPVISGDLGGGIRSWNLFGSFDGFDSKTINGNLFFENLEFTTAGVDLTIDNFLDFYPFRRGRYIGTAINALLDGNNFKAINIIVYDFERTPICITDISTTGGNIFIEKAT